MIEEMKRVFLMVMAVLLSLIGYTQPTSEYGVPQVVIPSPNIKKYAHLSWPKMTRMDDSTLVVALCAGDYHTGSNSPAISISSDHGRTFSDLEILKEFSENSLYRSCGNVALGHVDDRTILMAMAFTRNISNTIYGWELDLDGSDHQILNSDHIGNNNTGSVFGHVFDTPNGISIVGHLREDSLGDKTGLWISSLDDELWGKPVLITNQPLYEPTVIYCEDRYIGLARDANTAKLYWELESKNGINWTVEKSNITESEGGLPSPFIISHPEVQNRLLALETIRRKGADSKGDIYLWEKKLGDRDWKRTQHLIEFKNSDPENTDFGYPWMVHLRDDRWFMVFYYGKGRGSNSIWGLDLQID